MDLPVEDRSSEIADVLEEYMIRPAARPEPRQEPQISILGDALLSDGAIVKKAQAAKKQPYF